MKITIFTVYYFLSFLNNFRNMQSFQFYQELISNAINDLKYSREPAELYEPIEYILNLGGKRIRPVITLMCCELFDGDVQKAVLPAIGMEMFHNFTLVHDDIMDKAPIRRGKKTIHHKWDENRAILSGDTMIILANQLMLNADDDCLREVMELYNIAGQLVCDGQQFDLNYEESSAITLVDYIKMIELKTAALIASCFRLGAVIAKTSNENKDLVEKFGFNLGISFQIEDDILDVYGDVKKFGKTTGGDILVNKNTFLLVKAREIADEKTQAELTHWTSHKNHNALAKVRAVTEIFDRLDLYNISKAASHYYYDLSISYLDQVKVDKKRKKELYDFADFLINRDT
jgi:geranylgeranyl diphosphate synthase, type II